MPNIDNSKGDKKKRCKNKNTYLGPEYKKNNSGKCFHVHQMPSKRFCEFLVRKKNQGMALQFE